MNAAKAYGFKHRISEIVMIGTDRVNEWTRDFITASLPENVKFKDLFSEPQLQSPSHGEQLCYSNAIVVDEGFSFLSFVNRTVLAYNSAPTFSRDAHRSVKYSI